MYIFVQILFDHLRGWGVKALVKKAFCKSKMVTAREIRSANMCKRDLGMDIAAYPDFGFFLPNTEYNDKEAFLKANNIPTDRKLVAITARPHRFPHSADPTKAYNDFVSSMRQFAKWLYDEGFYPVFIEHVYAINNHENDSYCIQQIINGMEEGTFAYFADRTLMCYQLKRIYSYFDYIVGTRFHSMIFSMSNHVGMSSSTIWCRDRIDIGDNVKIGACCTIMDNDCHSLNYKHRCTKGEDYPNTKHRPVIIEDNVLIGVHSIILKGAHIGARSVIGAGSVVSGDIPADCIAAGNPCKVIKTLITENE